jgi:anti-sigma factor RsiW
MNAAEDDKSRNPPVWEELVAYLDGELEPARQLQVEQRLADDAAYRAEMIRLQRSWDLLDQLPRADTDEEFTKSTITMVALQTQTGSVAGRPTSDRIVRWLKWGGGLAFGAAAGFLLVAIPTIRAHRSQLRDVPVIENLDMYRYADSVEFLRLLDQEGLFSDDDEDVL